MRDRSIDFEGQNDAVTDAAQSTLGGGNLQGNAFAGTGSAPGKVILFGEHSVVYGHPAIAAPLPGRIVRAVLTRGETKQNRVLCKEENSLLSCAVECCLERFELSEIDVSLSGNLPMSVGLGSSGALAVALVRACAQASEVRYSDDFLLDAAMSVEKTFHGNPSGLDHTVSFTEKIIRFVRGAPFSEIHLPCPLSAVIWVVSPRGSAKERIAHIGEMAARDPQRIDGIFRDIGRISDEAASCLQSGSYDAAGHLMDCNHLRLSELGLSTPALDDACAQLRGAGAWGAKLTGAGGGGAGVALCEDAEAVLQKISAGTSEDAFSVRWEN